MLGDQQWPEKVKEPGVFHRHESSRGGRSSSGAMNMWSSEKNISPAELAHCDLGTLASLSFYCIHLQEFKKKRKKGRSYLNRSYTFLGTGMIISSADLPMNFGIQCFFALPCQRQNQVIWEEKAHFQWDSLSYSMPC